MQAETKYRLSLTGTIHCYKLCDTLTGYVSAFIISYSEKLQQYLLWYDSRISQGNLPWFCKRNFASGNVKFAMVLQKINNFQQSDDTMMTSSNGNIFRVTGHLCGEFTGHRCIPAQMPVTRSFHVFFDLRLNKQLSKQSWGWWFETQSRPLWRHCNG